MIKDFVRWEGISLKTLLSKLMESHWRGSRKIVRGRGEWRTPGEQGSLNQLSNMHMNTQRLKQQTQGLYGSIPGPLPIHCSYQLSTFVRLFPWKQVSLYFFWLLLELLSSCWVAISNFSMSNFASSYVWLLSASLVFPNKRQKECESR